MNVSPIEAPDSHHLNAAIGWLELGCPEETEAELRKITFLHQFHPDVLVVRWKIASRAGEWNRALAIAHWLVKIVPERPSGWICLSHSLCHTHSAQDAWDRLHNVAERFPNVSAIPYFLAKLSCRLGNNQEAARWLMRYYELESATGLKQAPAGDPHWETIWKQVGQAAAAPKSAAPVAATAGVQ